MKPLIAPLLIGSGVGALLIVMTVRASTLSSSPAALIPHLPTADSLFVNATAAATVLPLRDWSFEDPAITAQSAIVIDQHNGGARPLFQKNMLAVLPMASVTKLLTGLVAIDVLAETDTIQITAEDVAAPEQLGNLRVGELMSVRDLLAALLVESSNDAAWALARAMGGGSVPTAVAAMNRTSAALGLSSTHIADPAGLDPATRSSARDIALLLQESLRNPLLANLLTSPHVVTETHTFASTHRLFDRLEGLAGVKTGFTDEAGQVMVAQRVLADGRRITSAVLGSQDREQDTVVLHRWVDRAYRY